MSKKRNVVILTGPLRLERVETVCVEEEPVNAVFCVVETDRKAFGGYHQVMAYGETGTLVAAFWHAGGGAPLDCTVYGWLNTRHDLVSPATVVGRRLARMSGGRAG